MGSMDAQQIYDNFNKYAKGTQGLSTARETAQQLAAKYQDRVATTQQMIEGIQSGWQGNAAEAASQGLAPFAENALSNHQQLNTAQDIVSRQLDSFHTAVSEVRPVPPAPRMQNVITAVMSGQDPKPMITQIIAHQAIQQSNVDAYNKYVGASQYNTSNLPPVTTLNTQGAPVAITPPAPSSSTTKTPHAAGGGQRMQSVMPSGGAPRSAAPTTSGGGPLSPVDPVGSGPMTIASAAPPSIRSQSVAAPPSNGPAPVGPVEPILLLGGTGNQVGVPGPVEGGVPGKGSGSGLGGGADAVGSGEIGSGGARSGSGSSLVGGQPRAGARSGAAAPGEQGDSGGRSGAAASEEAALAAERGAAPGGATSTAAGPMTGGHGGDAEHRRKYDYDEDPDELFAATEKVAPPVLGETAVERQARYADQAGRHHSED